MKIIINFKKIYSKFERIHAQTSSDRYISYLRKKGVKIGEGCEFF